MTEQPEPPQGHDTADEDESGLVIVREEDDGHSEVEPEVDRPDKLLRLAGTVRGLLNEVRTAEVDEADDLVAELEAMSVDTIDTDASGDELRIVQAQLGGWLEGLFHGIQASMASQQAAQRQQLMQQLQQQQGQQPTGDGSGQYL